MKSKKRNRKEKHAFSQTLSSSFVKLVGFRLLKAMEKAMWEEVDAMEQEIRDTKVPKK